MTMRNWAARLLALALAAVTGCEGGEDHEHERNDEDAAVVAGGCAPATKCAFEVLAIEKSGNRTLTSSAFATK